jgi:hypothetical protein
MEGDNGGREWSSRLVGASIFAGKAPQSSADNTGNTTISPNRCLVEGSSSLVVIVALLRLLSLMEADTASPAHLLSCLVPARPGAGRSP